MKKKVNKKNVSKRNNNTITNTDTNINKCISKIIKTFDVYGYGGIKDKLIKKVIWSGMSVTELKQLIKKLGKYEYFIRCSGPYKRHCKKCEYYLEDDNECGHKKGELMLQCDNCDESHLYYTDINLDTKKAKCIMCKTDNFVVYWNEFNDVIEI